MRSFMSRHGTCLFLLCLSIAQSLCAQTVLVEAESFTHKGGWVIDQQFMDQMGSPFLLAHGKGIPVDEAYTDVVFPETGIYYLHVRTWDWNAPWKTGYAPGQFKIAIDDVPLQQVFGIKGECWDWQPGGEVVIKKQKTKISLQDMTGFLGRCDALLFTKDRYLQPPNENQLLAAYRKQLLGLPETPPDAGQFDFVVVGGGVAGISAAITASRLGLETALIQNRPVLGGNNSVEIKVVIQGKIHQEPYPALGNVVEEVGNVYQNPAKVTSIINAEEHLHLFLNMHAFDVEVQENYITAVYAKNIETNEELRFPALYYSDCTGDGSVGFLAGAEYRMGRETRGEFNESLAPEVESRLSYGSTTKWNTKTTRELSPFPDCPWAVTFTEETAMPVTQADWTWETGFHYDQIDQFEYIRDYSLRVIYGNWAYLKNQSSLKVRYSHLALDYVGYIMGKRESRRLIGDFILTQHDIEETRLHPDDTLTATYSIDQHFPHPDHTLIFPGEEFRSIQKHNHNPLGVSSSQLMEEQMNPPYQIPLRCLYSRNIRNLFMAGRNISVSRIALTSVRVQGTTGMMGEVVGMAASVCKNNNINPAEIYPKYFDALQDVMIQGIPQKYKE